MFSNEVLFENDPQWMNQYSTFCSTYTHTPTPTHHKAVTVFSTTVNMGCLDFRESIFNVIVFSVSPNFANVTHHGNVVFILDTNTAVPLKLLWGMVDWGNMNWMVALSCSLNI